MHNPGYFFPGKVDLLMQIQIWGLALLIDRVRLPIDQLDL